MCPYCQNPHSESGDDCMSTQCVERRYPSRPPQPIDKISVLRGYGRQVSDDATPAEVEAIAATIMACDCCGWENCCCGIPGAKPEPLLEYWRRHGY